LNSTNKNPAPGFINKPDHNVTLTPLVNHIVISISKVEIASSQRVIKLQESTYPAVFYFPREDVAFDLLTASEHTTYCPFKGHASYWSLQLAENQLENIAWSYELPFDEMLPIKNYIAFYQNKFNVREHA